jgi:hypothetical protein
VNKMAINALHFPNSLKFIQVININLAQLYFSIWDVIH